MGNKINIILLGYANQIADAQRKLEYYLNHENIFEEEISKTLEIIIGCEAKISKLQFYIKNNDDTE